MKKLIVLIVCCFVSFLSFSQSKEAEQKTFFGIEYKPIFSNDFFTSGASIGEDNQLTYTLTPAKGGLFGMVIRHNIKGIFSIETGINQITRNYNIKLTNDTNNFEVTDDFKFVSYEIPILGLVYVQTGKKTFINAGGGVSINFMPTDIETFQPNIYAQQSRRYAWLRTALLAQIGFEYRTEKSGIFYVGTSFHRPFKDLAVSRAQQILEDRLDPSVKTNINGRFLTVSLRYFFGPSTNEKTATP